MSMAKTSPDGWHLIDADAVNRRHPETFEIPSENERRSLRHGDLAKLCFKCDPAVYGIGAERMWVEVTSIKGRNYIGNLVNDPIAVEVLEWGDQIAFSSKHVLDIEREGLPLQ